MDSCRLRTGEKICGEMEKSMDIFKELCSITGEKNVLVGEPMSRHTTVRIGGPADYFVTPESAEHILSLIHI